MTSPRLRGEVAPRSGAGEGASVNPEGSRTRRARADQAQVVRARRLRLTQSDAEERLWGSLRNRRLKGIKFRRQYAVGGFFADFACPEAGLLIEVDGSQHAFTRDEDAARTRRLNAIGFRVMRFWTRDVMTRLDDVLGEIVREIDRPSPGAGAPTSPRKRGEVKDGA